MSTATLIKNKEPIRSRYLADRIMLLLLYKQSEKGFLERKKGLIILKVGWLARQLKMGSSRLYDLFLFLQEAGYLKMERTSWGTVSIKLKQPLGDDLESN